MQTRKLTEARKLTGDADKAGLCSTRVRGRGDAELDFSSSQQRRTTIFFILATNTLRERNPSLSVVLNSVAGRREGVRHRRQAISIAKSFPFHTPLFMPTIFSFDTDSFHPLQQRERDLAHESSGARTEHRRHDLVAVPAAVDQAGSSHRAINIASTSSPFILKNPEEWPTGERNRRCLPQLRSSRRRLSLEKRRRWAISSTIAAVQTFFKPRLATAALALLVGAAPAISGDQATTVVRARSLRTFSLLCTTSDELPFAAAELTRAAA
uniref:Uncharacterized protein n=1 Tax=Oryza punctata TaxID=4537 RepID=A0A0E0M172_ORYPU